VPPAPHEILARLLATAAALAVLLCAAAPARADGDPASDYLVTQDVYLPVFTIDEQIPAKLQERLQAVVASAKKRGYRIRVAVIASRLDLGAVPSLWLRPQTYARFLGLELRLVYRGRLLVVMPNGFGFYYPKHDTDRERALLARLSVAPGKGGVVRAAIDAVTRLAAT
jgi:hypothetical protein